MMLAGISALAAPKYPYQDANLPVEQRVEDLISRMTLEEKAGQIVCLMGWDSYQINGKKVAVSEKFRHEVDSLHVGMYWAVFRADPWTRKTIANGLNPTLAAQAANAMQRYAIEKTRLGIPIFLAEEAPHGHMAIGATVFPTGLGMAATWSRETMRQMGDIIGKEVRSQGGHISYGPVLDLAREPRWSRVEETLGEDPFLSGEMGAAVVWGLGGGDLALPHSTIATLKHFIAYGASEGGQNGDRSIVGPRELKQVFLPPFRRVLDAGALSVMTSYNSLDGIPCTSNHELLTGVLRNNWVFNRGIVVSDLFSIDGLRGTHRTATSLQDAAIQALKAMPGPTILIGGGYDKKSSYDEWIESFDGKVRYLVLMGQTRDAIADCAKKHGFTNIMYAEDMKEAVQVCASYANAGDYVLLSPACASWGMFKDFEERGRIFKDCVRSL